MGGGSSTIIGTKENDDQLTKKVNEIDLDHPKKTSLYEDNIEQKADILNSRFRKSEQSSELSIGDDEQEHTLIISRQNSIASVGSNADSILLQGARAYQRSQQSSFVISEEDSHDTFSEPSVKVRSGAVKNTKMRFEVEALLRTISLFPFDIVREFVDAMFEVEIGDSGIVIQKNDKFPHFVVRIDGEMLINGIQSEKIANIETLLAPKKLDYSIHIAPNTTLWMLARSKFRAILLTFYREEVQIPYSMHITPDALPIACTTLEVSWDLSDLLINAKRVFYAKGDYIQKLGAPVQQMMYVEQGAIEIRDPEANVLSIQAPGDPLCTLGTLKAYEKGECFSSFDLVALSDTCCISFSSENVKENFSFAYRLLVYQCLHQGFRCLDTNVLFTSTEIAQLATGMEEVCFEPGQRIAEQGKTINFLYVLITGNVLSVRQTGETFTIMDRLIPGRVFCLEEFISRSELATTIINSGDDKAYLWQLPYEVYENCADAFSTRHSLVDVFSAVHDMDTSQNHRISVQDFQVLKELCGSFGKVYVAKAKDTPDGPTRAIKVVRKDSDNETVYERFKQECTLMFKCRCPFLVQLVDFWEEGALACSMMDAFSGGDLLSYMKFVDEEHTKQDTISESGLIDLPTQCRFFVACIALGLHYLHRHGIIHRDVKPENILIDRHGYLRITDFGFAKETMNQRTHSMCGTPQYAAPEMFKGSGHGKEVDWWALGVMLYELASGFSPFHVESDDVWDCYSVVKCYESAYPHIQFPEEFPSSLINLLLSMLHPNPLERMGSDDSSLEKFKLHEFFDANDFGAALPWQAIISRTYQLPNHLRPVTVWKDGA